MANSNQNIETPWEFIEQLQYYFKVALYYDMAGTESNKKAPVVFTEDQNSLLIDWPTDRWCFVNPPFKRIGLWVDKCIEQKSRGCKILSLWQMSGDKNQMGIWKNSQVNIIHGRVFPEVRACVVCVWDKTRATYISGLSWDKKNGTLDYVW